jgi:hypothetical protein
LKKSDISMAALEVETRDDDLIRPEPKPDQIASTQGGLALLGLTFAVFALIAIYISTPIDSPEWPDCPIQTLGSCGEK